MQPVLVDFNVAEIIVLADGVGDLLLDAAKYPARCRLTDDDECGCLTFEIDRRRFSVRLTAPYSEDRRSKANETMTVVTAAWAFSTS